MSKAITNWKQYLQEGQHNSVDAILDFGKRIYEFKQDCDTKQGGSTFTADVQEWLGMSETTCKQWALIGAKTDKLVANSDNLPNSEKSIYLLTTLSEEEFNEALETDVIKPTATQKDITAFKKSKKSAYGWQVLAKGIFLTEATRDSKWFIKHIRPRIEAQIGEWKGNWIQSEDKAVFEAGARKAYAQWIVDKGDVSEIEAEAIALTGDLPESEKQKLEKLIKSWRKVVDIEIQEGITSELHKILPIYNADHEKFKKFNSAYKGIFTKTQYKQLLSVLHADKYVDGLDDLQKKKLDAMFSLIQDKRDVLCGINTESTGTLPTSVSELMKKRKVK